jgi:hypothetical protein
MLKDKKLAKCFDQTINKVKKKIKDTNEVRVKLRNENRQSRLGNTAILE